MSRDKAHTPNVPYTNIYRSSTSCFVSVEETSPSKFPESHIELCLRYEVGVKNLPLFPLES